MKQLLRTIAACELHVPLLLAATILLSAGCCRKGTLTQSSSDSLRVERLVEYRQVLRDSVVYVALPAETRETVRTDSSTLETSLAESFARIEPDGRLYHTLANKPQRMAVPVTVVDTEARERTDSVRVEYVRQTEVVRQRYVPALFWGCFFVTVAVAGWGVLRLVRRLKG